MLKILLGLTGLSPMMLLVAGFALTAAFGAGVVVEARWSQQLILTHAEKAKDRAIEALNKKVASMAAAAEADAQLRADRERELQVQVDELLEKAQKNASDKEVLPADLVDAIDRAGGLRNN